MKTVYKMMVKCTDSSRISPIEQSNRDVTQQAKYQRRYVSSKVPETLPIEQSNRDVTYRAN